MLVGLKGIGTDISQKAVENAEKNLLWIKNRYKVPPGKYELLVSDVKDLPENLPKLNYEAAITEGPLGPAYTKLPGKEEILINFSNLEKVYLNAFVVFRQILGLGKRVVIAFPAYRIDKAYLYFPIVDKLLKLGYDIVNPLPEVLLERYDFLQVTNRKSIIYDRKDQFVSREIFIFETKEPN